LFRVAPCVHPMALASLPNRFLSPRQSAL
jgi:hypothetical protein